MKKKLSEMTLEELWKLFPISLIEHQQNWANNYVEMEMLLKSKLTDCKIVRISHIGSTAIKNIKAKNIVDILLEIALDENVEKVTKIIEDIGFIQMSSSVNRVSFNYGYTEEGFGEKVYHLHLRYAGDNDELYFRDYLNEYSIYAQAYEKLKLDLWKKYEHDRDGYTNAKSEFVKKYTFEAKNKYLNKY